MKDLVLIKSYQNGISLNMNADCSFEELLEEIKQKFTDSKAFFGSARIALSMEGRALTMEEERILVNTIRECSNIVIVCLVGHDEETEKKYIHALHEIAKRLPEKQSDGQFYQGTLMNNQVVELDTNIIILGDVYPGCAVISSKNIIILGGLYGEAYAGGDGSPNHYVVALEMAPERIKIGDFKYKDTKQAKWGIKQKILPKIAFVKKEGIVLEPLTKELLDSF